MLVVNPGQAKAVQLIWTMYATYASHSEIRQHLVECGASQATSGGKLVWPTPYIYSLLRREYYYTGMYKISWDGKAYELPVPVIIDADTARRVQERKARYKPYPSGNLKEKALGAGVVYCRACGVRMIIEKHQVNYRGRKYTYLYYRCPYDLAGMSLPGCVKHTKVDRADADFGARCGN